MKKNIYAFSLIIILGLAFSYYTEAETIHSTITGGKWNSESTWIGDLIPGASDTAVINGPVIVGNVIGYDIFHTYAGWVQVESNGSLRPHEYGGGLGTFILHIAHDITNNGTIHNGSILNDYEYLQLNVNGNITNNSNWQPQKTMLTGNDQRLSLGAGNTFGGYWAVTSAASIHAESDLYFDCKFYTHILNVGHFDMNGATLHMGDYAINTTGTIIYGGTIEGDFSVEGRFVVSHTSQDTMFFIGNVTVTDTIESNEYGGGLGTMCLHIDGNIINNGVIRDDDDSKNDDRLNIIITGDITNNGKWSCYHVNLAGAEEQSIYQGIGKEFDSYFADLDSVSSIRANSGITVKRDFNLGRATLYMENHVLEVNGWLHNGYLDNAMLTGGYLQYLDITNGLDMHGKVIVDDSVSIEGNVIVNDTLMPNVYGGGAKHFPLEISGSFVNNGVIMDNYWGESLILYIYGNIANNGEWINHLTHVYVSNEQYIELIDNKPINGAVQFDAVVEAISYQWYYDNTILDSEDFDGETTKVLQWLVPVSSDWYGSFSCETGSKESIGIIIKQGNLGVEDGQMQEISFDLFPNPCRNEISIRHSAPCLPAVEAGTRYPELTILDISGRVVYDEELGRWGEGEISVDVSHLPAGLYMVKLQTGDGVGVRKFIKK